MAANNTKDWSDLLDVVLFEADRVNLQRRMEHADGSDPQENGRIAQR